MTSIKNSTWQKIATALAAIDRRSMNCRGKTRELATTPRRPKGEVPCGMSDTGTELVSAQSEATCGDQCHRGAHSKLLECARDGGQFADWELTGAAGLSEDESHGQAPLP